MVTSIYVHTYILGCLKYFNPVLNKDRKSGRSRGLRPRYIHAVQLGIENIFALDTKKKKRYSNFKIFLANFPSFLSYSCFVFFSFSASFSIRFMHRSQLGGLYFCIFGGW